MEACCDTSATNEKWLNRLALSSWLTHVKEVLNCGCLVAQCVEKVINQPLQVVNFIDLIKAILKKLLGMARVFTVKQVNYEVK